MAALSASIALALAILILPGTVLATSAELAPYAVLFGLVFCLLFLWGTRLTSRTIIRLGFRASRLRILIMVATWVVFIPNILSSIFFWVLLAEGSGSSFAQAMPTLWFMTTLLSTIPLGLYHIFPSMIGSTIVNVLPFNGMLSSLQVDVWSILCSVLIYGSLTIVVVIASHFFAVKHAQRNDGESHGQAHGLQR